MPRPRIIEDAKLIEGVKQGKSFKVIGTENNPPVSHIAVFKRAKRLGLSRRLPQSLEKLTEKEKAFCLAVVNGQSRINAVMQTYDVTTRASAKALQKKIMESPKVKLAIDQLMEIKGIGKEFRIDLLGAHMRNPDPIVSLKALDMGMKIADDAGERTKGIPDTLSFTKFDVSLLDTDD